MATTRMLEHLGAVLGHLGGHGLGHVEAGDDERGILLLLAVFLDGFLQFDPLQAGGGVELVEVLDDAVDVGVVVLARLRVGEVLAHVGVDELAGVHVAHLGRRNLDAQLGGLLVEQGLVDEVLPHLLADLVLHLGGHLGGLLLHLVVVLHLLDQLVEALARHRLAVHGAHVGHASLVLGQVAKDERNNSNTDQQYCHPRMFSNTSDNSHFV